MKRLLLVRDKLVGLHDLAPAFYAGSDASEVIPRNASRIWK
jgi:hypothetical protein